MNLPAPLHYIPPAATINAPSTISLAFCRFTTSSPSPPPASTSVICTGKGRCCHRGERRISPLPSHPQLRKSSSLRRAHLESSADQTTSSLLAAVHLNINGLQFLDWHFDRTKLRLSWPNRRCNKMPVVSSINCFLSFGLYTCPSMINYGAYARSVISYVEWGCENGNWKYFQRLRE